MNIPSGCLRSDGMSFAEGLPKLRELRKPPAQGLRPELQWPRHQP